MEEFEAQKKEREILRVNQEKSTNNSSNFLKRKQNSEHQLIDTNNNAINSMSISKNYESQQLSNNGQKINQISNYNDGMHPNLNVNPNNGNIEQFP